MTAKQTAKQRPELLRLRLTASQRTRGIAGPHRIGIYERINHKNIAKNKELSKNINNALWVPIASLFRVGASVTAVELSVTRLSFQLSVRHCYTRTQKRQL